MKAKAMLYAAPGRVEMDEVEVRDPDIDEVQIELKATALCAWDLALFQGPDSPTGVWPFLHGHEGVGVVRKVGARVKGLREGDRVTAMGNEASLFGQFANVPESCAVRLPDSAERWEHWVAEPVACVVNGLEWCGLVPGDRVCVVGTGFMGLMWVQGLAHTLAQEVVGIDIDARRLALARQFGADRTIDLTAPGADEALAELREKPFDLVIEVAGKQPALDVAYSLLRPSGTLTIFSWQRGGNRSIDLGTWHMSGFRVMNSGPAISPHFNQAFRRAVPLMERGVFDLKPLVTHVVPVEQAQGLFEAAVAHADGYIKGVVTW